MNLPTIIVASIIAIIFIAIIVKGIINKKQGKHSCAGCGGSCSCCQYGSKCGSNNK